MVNPSSSGGSPSGSGGASSGGRSGGTPDGGTADAGFSDAGTPRDGGGGAGGANAPTWTQVYSTLLNSTTYASNCAGAPCHNPGTSKNVRLSTSALGYTSIRAIVTPGSATAGNLIRVLSSGAMPRGRPRMPAADLDKIKAWIVAGALNN